MDIADVVLNALAKVIAKIFGSANERELKRLWPLVIRVNEEWAKIRHLSDEELRAKTREFRLRILAGESEDDLLPEAFAVCREASHRTLGGKKMVPAPYDTLTWENGRFVYKPVQGEIPLFAHFDVQILGGIVLHQGNIAEMVTGEGKTLVATLPIYLNALRPTDAWIAKARELQGEDPSQWIFKPYGLYRDAEGKEVWQLLDCLVPEPGDVTYRPPERIIPLSRGIHVVTVNDYLAKRDAEYNRPLFTFLGITVGAIQAQMDSATRIPIYMCDVVYGTNNEFGFDYLRDNLKVYPEDQVQRSRFFAIIDEVDSVLIDEARTPLIISGSPRESSERYYQADRIARKLKGGDMNTVEDRIAALMKEGYQREEARLIAEEDWDYVYSERDHTAKLTERGMNRVLRELGMEDIYSGTDIDMPHLIDNALKAHSLYKRDHHYIVKDGQVFIVDEFTGRVLEGRRWSDGLHQAVEAKEHLRIKEETQTVATITLQNFFRLYERLAGMTGTAMTEAKEFMNIYNLGVVSIPTNRPLRRINYPDLIYGTMKEKYQALVEHIVEVHRTGRPLLIGTVSIERSEIISSMLEQRGVRHEVLNAKHHAREAEIVAQAGQFAAVTVATNMAGRGTDIVLGAVTREQLLEHWKKWGLAPKKGIRPEMSDEELMAILRPHWVAHYLSDLQEPYESRTPEEWDQLLRKRWDEMGIIGPRLCTRVAEMGGLHIVGTERHEARRIDNQLRGRAGRQGDPGSSRFFLSLEDDTMRLFAPEKVANILRRMGLSEGVPIESAMVTRAVERAQRKVEERNFEIRKNLLEYDSVMNEQRTVVYNRRQAWLEGRELRESVLEFCEHHILRRIDEYLGKNVEAWDIPALCRFFADAFLIEIRPSEIEEKKRELDPQGAITDMLLDRFYKAYEERERQFSETLMRGIEKLLLLDLIDRKWMDHLYAMDLLKEGIHLWGYAGQDPKIRYKREAYEIFQEMWESLESEVAELILRVHLRREPLPPTEAPSTKTLPPEFALHERVKVASAVHQEFQALAAASAEQGANAGEVHREPIRNVGGKTRPNDPCPCGSGRKFKKCCGK